VSISLFTIVVLVVAAVALKVSVLIGIAVAAFRRFDRWPVYGVWYQEADELGRPSFDREGDTRSPLFEALSALLDRDMRRIEISRSGDTVVVRSADGVPVSYGSAGCRVTRSLGEGLQLESTWLRQGDVMKLESDLGGKGKLIETYECAGQAMQVELRITVPSSQLDRMEVRRFRRSSPSVAVPA
jgi:hypothetical protein